MKVKVRPLGIKPNVGWAVEYTNHEGIEVSEVFNEYYQAEERACRLEGVQYDGPVTAMEPLDAIRAALEWLDCHAVSNARAVLVAALEADANRSHPELPTPF